MKMRTALRACIAALIAVPAIFSTTYHVGGSAADERLEIVNRMERQSEHYGELSRRIWEFAEVGYKENKSADLLKAELRSAGFRIEENIAGIPTAFVATYGSGKPVIGILGEYDALPGLSQDSTPEKKPVSEGAPGHGCGHNLFGVASAFAAITVKDHLVEKKLSGTIRFYGTPAEEGGSGKVFMARQGVFSDCDVALVWHPSDQNRASMASSLANISAKFRFYGKAAHAAGSPEMGRSSLDAVMIATHAIDLLREHVPQTTRIHYIVTNGGAAPNIVPDFSEVYVYARHPEMTQLDGIWDRILRCIEAGALATETRVEKEIISSVFNLLPNEPLTKLYDRHLRFIGGIRYTAEEQAFADKLRGTLTSPPESGHEKEIKPIGSGSGYGSTDVGDVSWIVPTAEFNAATWVPGTPAHSWQAVACGGYSIGRKGMLLAAKTLALSAIDLLKDPALVAAARADFEKRRAGFEYRSRIPADQKPPLNYRNK